MFSTVLIKSNGIEITQFNRVPGHWTDAEIRRHYGIPASMVVERLTLDANTPTTPKSKEVHK